MVPKVYLHNSGIWNWIVLSMLKLKGWKVEPVSSFQEADLVVTASSEELKKLDGEDKVYVLVVESPNEAAYFFDEEKGDTCFVLCPFVHWHSANSFDALHELVRRKMADPVY